MTKPPNYPLECLIQDPASDIGQQLFRIRQTMELGHLNKAIGLCTGIIGQVSSLRRADRDYQAYLGLAYCHLGEIYRRKDPTKYNESSSALENAVLHFSLDGNLDRRDWNEAITHWLWARLDRQRPDELPRSLHHYETTLHKLAGEWQRIQDHRSLPNSQRAKLLEKLQEVHDLVQQEYLQLRRDHALKDPKLAAWVASLEQASQDIQQVVADLQAAANQANATAITVTQAAEKALQDIQQAVRSAGATPVASHAAAPAVGATANTQAALDQMRQVTQQLQQALDRLDARTKQPPPPAVSVSPVVGAGQSITYQDILPSIPYSLLAAHPQPDLAPIPLADLPIAAGQAYEIDRVYLDPDNVLHLPRELLPPELSKELQAASATFGETAPPARIFAIQVQGDSMIDAMVNDGDIVIVRRQESANHKDMVVALLTEKDRNESTLKYFMSQGGRTWLQPANPALEPILVEPDGLRIQARVFMIIHK